MKNKGEEEKKRTMLLEVPAGQLLHEPNPSVFEKSGQYSHVRDALLPYVPCINIGLKSH